MDDTMAAFRRMTAELNKRQRAERTCNHHNAATGLFQWDGQTYCSDCCKHNFGCGQNFVEDTGDGFMTCMMCFVVVREHVRLPPHPYRNQLVRERNRARKQLLKRPKITLTKPDGKNGRVKVG